MTLETQQPELKQEQLQDAKAALGEKALKDTTQVEQTPDGTMKVAEKLKQKEGAINALLKIPSSGSDKITGSVVELKETKDYLPSSVFINAIKKNMPKNPNITAEKLKGTGLEKKELENLIGQFLSLPPGSAEHKDATRKIQTKILQNSETGTNYYPPEKKTTADGKPGPYTGLALLNFMGADSPIKATYKFDIKKQINDHNKEKGLDKVFEWMPGA